MRSRRARVEAVGRGGLATAEYVVILVLLAAVLSALVYSVLPGGSPPSLPDLLRERADAAAETAIGALPAQRPAPSFSSRGTYDGAEVSVALHELRTRLDPAFPGVTSGDLEHITSVVVNLGESERDALITALNDGELDRWLGALARTSSLPWSDVGDSERARLFGALLPVLSEVNVARVLIRADALRPTFADAPGLDPADVVYGPLAGAVLVQDGIEADDVVEGAGGDTLLAAAAALADRDAGAIDRLIEDNHNGTYTVTFGGAQDPVPVTITDEFPLADGGSAFASAGTPPELWPLVLEKAWAQLHGSYGAADRATDAAATLAALSGGPVDVRDPADEPIAVLADAFEAGEAVTVQAHDRWQLLLGGDDEEYRQPFTDARGRAVAPLELGRSYTVLAVDRDGATVTLRDPRGPVVPVFTLAYDHFQQLFTTVAITEPAAGP
jgi:hypothetical protein